MGKQLWLSAALLLSCSPASWAIYGPSLMRADPLLAAQACREANFPHSREMAKALQTGNSSEALRLLGGAVSGLESTSTASPLYPARAFCVHELVPSSLAASEAEAERNRQRAQPEVRQIAGTAYFFYEPDRRWTLGSNPVDLRQLAGGHLDSRWGRQAFLMMTQMGWSDGGCREGPDQFREVIKRSEDFLAGYPQSEISGRVRFELANAYATWWYLSRAPANLDGSPGLYGAGAREARQKAIALYRSYGAEEVSAAGEVETRLKALEQNTVGASTYDYFCPEYED